MQIKIETKMGTKTKTKTLTKSVTDSDKSVYMPPEIVKVGEIEIEHPLLSASIIPDNHEVVIDEQKDGVHEDFTGEGWD